MSKANHIVEPEELMAYLDGELPAEQAIDTAGHLESCRECQRLAADLKEVSETMMAWEAEIVEPQIGKMLEAALSEEDHTKRRKSKVRRTLSPRLLWAGGLVATALVIFAVSTLRFAKSPNEMRPYVDLERTAATPQPRNRANAMQGYSAESRITPSGIPAGAGASMADFASSTRPAPMGSMNTTVLDGILKHTDQETEKPDVPAKPPASNGPMIVRTAELAVTTKDFDGIRANVDEILKRHHGYVGVLNVNTPAGSARSLTATLRVPADGLGAVLADLKHLGRTEKESQTGEEVTQQYVDLQARLANAKHTEQRLSDIQLTRTCKLSDVLAVEMQIGRVRGEIEQMEAERKNMKNQVDFATLKLTISEDYKAELKVVPPSTSTQFRNAAVDGYRSLVDGIISVLLWLLSAGPTLLVWAAILFFPVRFVW